MHTHTHNHFTTLLDFVRDYLGEPAPERQNQEGKVNQDLLEQERVSCNSIRWAICKSAPWTRHITMPASHHSVFFAGRMPFLPPNQQHQSTEGIEVYIAHTVKTSGWCMVYISVWWLLSVLSWELLVVAACMDSKSTHLRMSCSSRQLPTSRLDQWPTVQRASATPTANDKCHRCIVTRDAQCSHLLNWATFYEC